MDTKQDRVRLRAILRLLISPFEMPEMEHLTNDAKLWHSFNAMEIPIYRRPILSKMQVRGMWWMDEKQYTPYLWQGHNAIVIKSDQDPDRVLTTRTVSPSTTNQINYAYIRELPTRIDLEVNVVHYRWGKTVKKTVREWLTVSISKDEYFSLDKHFGPIEDGCVHENKD